MCILQFRYTPYGYGGHFEMYTVYGNTENITISYTVCIPAVLNLCGLTIFAQFFMRTF